MFREKLKQARLVRNKSQEEVATAVGITSRTYMDYENGKNEPKLSTAIEISKYLKTPLSLLINDEEDESRQLEEIHTTLKGLNEEDRKIFKKIIDGLQIASYANMLSKDVKFEDYED